MNKPTILKTERVDDIPLLLAQLERMGVQELLDEHFPTHGNWKGLSLGQVAIVWLSHILSQADHRMNQVQSWAEQRIESLGILVGQEVRGLDLSDDRLESIVFNLSKDESWNRFEQDLSQQQLQVYDLKAERVRLDSTSVSGFRGTFDKAFDHQTLGNVLYGLQGGPLIPGCKPPKVLTLDRDDGSIRMIPRDVLLKADVIITNFHSVGNGDDENDLLSKLKPDEIDFIVIDEAHIAAAESYQRAFQHFQKARSLLMSACFQRLDGKTIDADIVYQYRSIDSIADGHAKNLRVQRFAPDVEQT